ncbi:MAG TPA: glycosyltransferase family 2 protein [bacterium]|nr:glycosyltransferase family 2 protein [bacterium]
MLTTLSIIIPVFNEEKAITATLRALLGYLSTKSWKVDVMVINDGSTDGTLEKLQEFGEKIKIISHPYNKGYGAAIKTGVRASMSEWILTFDGDGQHRFSSLDDLIAEIPNYDLIIGARTNGYKGPWLRQPGKKILHWLAEYLVQAKIPDLNSGLRLARKDLMQKYLHLFPNGYSLSSTSTMAFLKDGQNVKFVPIEINPRQNGKSAVSLKDGFKTIMLMVRLVMLFSPLRVFVPVSFLLLCLFLVSFVYDVILLNLTDTTVLLLVTGLLIFFFGLLADQIAALRRETDA